MLISTDKTEESTVALHTWEDDTSDECNTKKDKLLPRILVTLTICILDVICGAMITWPAVALTELQHPNSTLVLTQDEGSWVVSILTFGAVPGALTAGFLAHRFGRRMVALVAALPLFISMILIIFAQNVWMLYLSRILAGLTLGGGNVAIAMYIFEISGQGYRANFGAVLPLSMSFGTLLCLVLSLFLNYQGISMVLAGMCVLFVVLFYFAPESPVYHVIKEDLTAARKSLKVLHRKHEVRDLLQEIVSVVEETTRVEKVTLKEMMKDKIFLRGLTIGLGNVAAYQFCGLSFIMPYTEKIFKDADASLDPKFAANIIFAVQFLSACVQLFIAERFPRRMLLLQNSITSCVALGTVGIQLIFQWKAGWLPIVCLIFNSVSFTWGYGPLAIIVLAELVPAKAIEYAFASALLVTSLLNFLITKTFPFLVSTLGMGWTFLIFSGFMILASFHIIFFVPETSGKSLIKIQDELGRKI